MPFLNEAGCLPELIARLRAVLDGESRRIDVVLVDDGSDDESAAVASNAIEGDSRFRLVRLGKNYGKSAAIAAGRDHASGDVVVTIDADLQDPPSAIPEFLRRIDDGCDVVAGWRRFRKERLHRRCFSAVFNGLMRVVAGVPIHDMNCGLKAYRREVLQGLHLTRGTHRFTAILAFGQGYCLTELEVDHQPRHAGRSKYGPWRYFETSIGLLAAFYISRPRLSPMAGLGMPGAALTLLSLVGFAVLGAVGPDHLGVAPWLAWGGCALVLVLGVQVLLCGLIGELVLQHAARGALPPLYRLREPERGR